MKKINIQVYFSSAWHNVFTGYVESYNPSWISGGGYGSIMTLHCVGIIGKILALQVLNNAGYASEADGTRVTNVLTECGIPVGWQSVDAGDYTLIASGANVNVNALDHLQKVQETSLSLLYELPDSTLIYEDRGHRNAAPHLTSQATFGTGAGEIPYTSFSYVKDEVLLFNDVRFTRTGGTEQVVTNSTSQATYGKRSYVKSNTLHTTDTMAWLTADFICSRYATPIGRVESMLIVPDSDTKWGQCITREISDRITFKNTTAGINKDYFIEGINHDWNFVSCNFSTEFQLSDATQYLNPPDAIDEILRPSAAGDKTENLKFGGATNWECVKEVIPDENTTYVYLSGLEIYTDLYKIPPSSYNIGTINSVIITIRSWMYGASALSRTHIKTEGTEYDGVNNHEDTYTNFTTTYTTNPFTGVAWTWAEITDLQIGVKHFASATSTVRTTQVFCTVNFTPTW
jgi:hypothetical protein